MLACSLMGLPWASISRMVQDFRVGFNFLYHRKWDKQNFWLKNYFKKKSEMKKMISMENNRASFMIFLLKKKTT